MTETRRVIGCRGLRCRLPHSGQEETRRLNELGGQEEGVRDTNELGLELQWSRADLLHCKHTTPKGS